MTQTIQVELTDTQYKRLEYAALSPTEWAENAVTERCRIANDEIVSIYTNRALDEGIQIPATRELIVADAFTRGWVKTAVQRKEEEEAAQALSE